MSSPLFSRLRRPAKRPRAFTLVELLVVIGIIALLISILLPALNKARAQANTVKCASNLRTIGQGIAQYVAAFRGALPPSNYYKGELRIVSGVQYPDTPTNGFVHWSSFLYGNKAKLGTDEPFLNETGWDAFKCPSLDRGGLAPANTYQGNNDSFANEAPGNVIDWQAPRNAYTLNEALCPRGIFGKMAPRGNLRNYRFVQAGRVKNSGGTILGTELSGVQDLVRSNSLIDNSTPVSGSRRPVNGFVPSGGIPVDEPYKISPDPRYTLDPVERAQLGKDPEANVGSSVQTLLDYVGRNHNRKRLDAKGYDTRISNFLYLDGHVESKSVLETLTPFQWGERFYTLDR
jgi:prepilin-type N-terminal cleavage/methylation domain-containing protein/prepilin-type processing-associated H-X9-DG protein